MVLEGCFRMFLHYVNFLDINELGILELRSLKKSQLRYKYDNFFLKIDKYDSVDFKGDSKHFTLQLIKIRFLILKLNTYTSKKR